MDFESLVTAMSSETYHKLADAVATGRWADGTPMTEQQRAQSMQLVMAYQARVLRSDEPFTIGADGQMVTKTKSEMKASLQPQSAIATFQHDDL